MKKIIIGFFSLIIGLFIFVAPAMAHVTVKPGEVGVGERLNFVVSVPTEEVDPTVQVRLVLPEGLQSVRPNTKPGWNIQLKKTGEEEGAKVTEIIWSGGRIPAEQKDEFIFSAQAPAQQSTLVWKAYQTYGDGDIVAWEVDPKMVEEYTQNNPLAEGQEDDHSAPKPYSVTTVTNDLKPATGQPVSQVSPIAGGGDNLNSVLSVVAVVLSVIALGMNFLKKKTSA